MDEWLLTGLPLPRYSQAKNLSTLDLPVIERFAGFCLGEELLMSMLIASLGGLLYLKACFATAVAFFLVSLM